MDTTARGPRSPRTRNIATGPGLNDGVVPSAPPQFTCLQCDRSFSTKTGLGVHRRRAHLVEVNNEIVTERVKARWSVEETTLMAAEEARLVKNGETFVNEPLTNFMSGRSVEAVKGKRRQAAYKSLVQQLLLAMVEEVEEPIGGAESFSNATGDAESFSAIAEVSPHEIAGGGVLISAPSETQCIPEFIRDLIGRIPFSTTRRAVLTSFLPIVNRALDGVDVDEAIGDWLRSSFPKARKPKGPTQASGIQIVGSRRKQRRARYSRIQRTYERSRRDAARMVLQDSDTRGTALPNKAEMFQYWSQVLSNSAEPAIPDGQAFPPGCPELSGLWAPITENEVKSAKLRQGSACGPDGISAKSWSRVALLTRTLFFNMLLMIGRLPSKLRGSRTIFLAKKADGSTNPSDFRPISISSVIVRQFHRIIANRFTVLYNHKSDQSAYQHFDGVGKSVAVLSTILDESWRDRKELHLACLDAAKAFNSVTFMAIRRTLEAIGCPREFMSYISDVYTDVRTTLQFEGTEQVTRIGRGVLQGDPLSGPIFMAVFECAVMAIDRHVGFRTGDGIVNAIAYADDIVLAASTRNGLQRNLDRFESALHPIGLSLNSGKSFTLSLVPSGKEKKVKVVTSSQPFRVTDGSICAKAIDDVWKYLGLNFEGRVIEAFDGKLPASLDKISTAPLKPQQRLQLLKEHVVPGVLHRLVLGTSTAATLKAADVTIRLQTRKWLHLPHDTPLGFFYTPVKQGGLGLPCLQHLVPLHRLNRYNRIRDSMEGNLSPIKDGRHVQSTLFRSLQALAFLGPQPDKAALNKYWRERLVGSVDGKELEEIGHHSSDTKWASGGNMVKTRGEDFIHYVAMRINAIPSRDRMTRGRKGQANVVTSCRGGCPAQETTYHTIQTCYRSKGVRMQRHNRVVDLLATGLESRGFSVTKERRLVTEAGALQPDLVVVKAGRATVIDAQVVSGQCVDAAHFNKLAKYRGTAGFDDAVRLRHGVDHVQHIPCTITYRGAWSKRSVSGLVGLGVPERTFHMVVTSVLRGSWMCWRMFNRVKAVRSLRHLD